MQYLPTAKLRIIVLGKWIPYPEPEFRYSKLLYTPILLHERRAIALTSTPPSNPLKSEGGTTIPS
jgi:hypothetical protein